MKVKELIEMLSKYDQEYYVMFFDYFGNNLEIKSKGNIEELFEVGETNINLSYPKWMNERALFENTETYINIIRSVRKYREEVG